MSHLNVKASAMNTAFVMRANAREFAAALKDILDRAQEDIASGETQNCTILDVTYNAYYDTTRKRPVYSALIAFSENAEELEDLNEDDPYHKPHKPQKPEKPSKPEKPKEEEHHHHHDHDHHHGPHHHRPPIAPPLQWLDIESPDDDDDEGTDTGDDGCNCDCCTIHSDSEDNG